MYAPLLSLYKTLYCAPNVTFPVRYPAPMKNCIPEIITKIILTRTAYVNS
jgi:hypothetical protein